MKFLFFLLLYSNVTYSQLWFDVGVKGGVGTGYLINNTITKDQRLSVTPGINNFYGGKIGINFGKTHALTLDGSLMNNQYSFLQTGLGTNKESYKYSINYSTLTISTLYRNTKGSQYLEIGPEISLFQKGSIQDEYQKTTTEATPKIINNNLASAVFGFGGYVIGSDVLSLSMGLRFHYTFSNLTSKDYSSSNFPLINYSDITSNASSHPLAIQVLFELNWAIGQVAKSTCGKRTAFIRF